MKNPTLLALIVAIFGILLLPFTQSVKVLLVLIAVAVVLYIRRGYILVALGSRALNAKPPQEDRAWRYYRQAWKAGLPAHYTVMLGNLFVQRGDPSIALEIYDSVIAKEQKKRIPEGDIIVSGRISRTMALWALDRGDEAIEELKTLYEEGRRDKSLLINLGTYLLASERLDEARDFLEECSDLIAESPGMTDNQGLYLLKTGALLEAKEVYDTLLSGEGPRFPEAYVHAGQVMLALGKNRRAYALFEQALEKEFFKTASVTREMVEQMMEELRSNPNTKAEDDDVDAEITASLYETDLFDDSVPNTEVDEDDEIEPNIELDPEDYDDEEDPEVHVDEDDISVESLLFDHDDDDDDDEEPRK